MHKLPCSYIIQSIIGCHEWLLSDRSQIYILSLDLCKIGKLAIMDKGAYNICYVAYIHYKITLNLQCLQFLWS